MANQLSEFEKVRYRSLSKRFVEIYVLEEPLAAGQFIMGELKESEELVVLREYVVDAFKDQGYQFDDLEKVLED